VQIGSLTGDALWAILGLAGVGWLVRVDSLRVPIGVAGVVYLVWLAWDAWQASRYEFVVQRQDAGRSRSALRAGILLSLTNPQNVGYWAALGSALVTLGVDEPDGSEYSAFFAGFMLSSVVWAFACAAVVEKTLGRVGVRWARVTHRVCALVFLTLAIASLRELSVSREGHVGQAPPDVILGAP
jgi:chemosensory pili system protein ChpE/L-lysine exporter family protein LysE/ArgO